MYGIYTYIWLIFIVNVGKYTIHGSYGICRVLSWGEASLINCFLLFKSSGSFFLENRGNSLLFRTAKQLCTRKLFEMASENPDPVWYLVDYSGKCR